MGITNPQLKASAFGNADERAYYIFIVCHCPLFIGICNPDVNSLRICNPQ